MTHAVALLAALALLAAAAAPAAAAAGEAGGGRQLAALPQSYTVQTIDVQNEFIKQMQSRGITQVLLLENSLATPFFRGVIKTGLGYTSVSVDDNADEQHKLHRVWRVGSMGLLHPEYASTGKLAIAVAFSGKVRGAAGRGGGGRQAAPARCAEATPRRPRALGDRHGPPEGRWFGGHRAAAGAAGAACMRRAPRACPQAGKQVTRATGALAELAAAPAPLCAHRSTKARCRRRSWTATG
jgi:hypothetical protein